MSTQAPPPHRLPSAKGADLVSPRLISVAAIAACAIGSLATVLPATAAPSSESAPKPAVKCDYKDSVGDEGPKAPKPQNNDAVANTGTLKLTLKTNQGDIALSLDRAKAPCTVHSMEHLTDIKYLDNSTCHRMVLMSSMGVLQCGDATGQGSGGPGYNIKDELPTGRNQYKRGVLAMANAGPNTNGSQFFMVFRDTPMLPNDYTIFGTVEASGMTVVDKVAAGGITGSGGDGKPKLTTTIQQIVKG
ncbi:O-acetylhomoserine aminocarboxypropyltransferase [Platysternon megacephalum]|uniref:Peptidyl-prolyl cis-trans isomerase n=1 Tax=Platysternon megacephalum TaxID=55544 RepID=A0A4D9DCR8_9SAUR|nr:O-acetylhomoserine aminocarboxypropyltransferase [Platysternon megacephalum]